MRGNADDCACIAKAVVECVCLYGDNRCSGGDEHFSSLDRPFLDGTLGL